ncbi:MAG: hypothetical protein IKJ11_07825 [Clostridia bacterium]|nr:hypothetical protein [Clostridia bacterium]
MTAATAFAHREDALLAQLESAKNMDQAISACVLTLEQVACELAQDEQDEQARQRQQAVMAAVRRAPQLLRSVCARGELVIGENTPAQRDTKNQIRRIVKIAGAFLLGALCLYEMINGRALFALFQLVGANLLFFSGESKPAAPADAQPRGVAFADAKMLLRSLRELCQAADICVADLMLLEKDTGAVRLSGTADDAMLDLLTALMEAKASGRSELALRSLSQAEQYLRMLGVELIFFDSKYADLFDTLPTMGESRTIRPAMIQDGKLLRRGVAALSTGRGVGA